MSSTLIVESGPADGAGAATTICLPMAAGIDGPEPWPGTNDVVESSRRLTRPSSHDEASPPRSAIRWC